MKLDASPFILQEGGLNGFMHSFLAEVMAICRAHVAALGGNALVAYKLTECIIEDNLHKNQVKLASYLSNFFFVRICSLMSSEFSCCDVGLLH